MIDSRMQSMASNKSSSANQSNQSLLNDAYPSSPTLGRSSEFFAFFQNYLRLFSINTNEACFIGERIFKVLEY